MAFLCACGESEAKREEKAMAAAIPRRLQSDGSLELTDADVKALGLKIEAAVEGTVASTSLRYGVVQAPMGEDALVVSPVAGRIAQAPSVALGGHVKAGDALVDVTPTLGVAERVSLGVQGADIAGQVEALTHEVDAKEKEVARNHELAKSNVVSAQVVQQSETALAGASAKLEALRQAQKLRTSVEGVRLRAPVDGTLVELEAQTGAAVQAGQSVARILRSGGRWVDVAMQPQEKPGTAYEIEIDGERVPARLLSAGFVVAADGTRHDRVVVDGGAAARLLPGATVAVQVAGDAKAGVVVDDRAVLPTAAGDVVFINSKQAPLTFVMRPVKVAARLAGRARVDGIQAGDRVVVEGAPALYGESMRAELRHTE